MRRRLTAVLVWGLAALVGRAGDPPAKSPGFEALKKEYEAAQKKYVDEILAARKAALKALKEATTDEERKAAQKKLNTPLSLTGGPALQFAPKFLAFAEKNPTDPAAFDALLMAFGTSDPTDKSGTYAKVVVGL